MKANNDRITAAKSDKKSSLDTMPSEILVHIFSFIDQQTLFTISLVCKRLLNVAKTELTKTHEETSQFLGFSRDQIKEYFTKSGQEEFGKAFAKSVFTGNDFFFNILKEVVDNDDNELKPDYEWTYDVNKENGRDAFEKAECIDGFWGKSLLYFVIERGKTDVALYLINSIKNDDRYPLSRKEAKQCGDHAQDIPWTKKELVNLGFATFSSTPESSSPLTLCLQDHSSNKKLIEAIMELHGKVFIHDGYYEIPSFTGYGEAPYEVLLYILKDERKYRKQFHLRKLKQLEDRLKILEENNLKHKNSRELPNPTKSSKRKRDELKKPDESKLKKTKNIASDSIFSKKEPGISQKLEKPTKRPRHGN